MLFSKIPIVLLLLIGAITVNTYKTFIFYGSPSLDRRIKDYQHKNQIESKSKTIKILLDTALKPQNQAITDNTKITDIKKFSAETIIKNDLDELKERLKALPV